MITVTQFMESTFPGLTLIFAVSNLAVMGLQINSAEMIAGLKSPKVLVLIFLFGWVLGPALAYLIVWILPLSEAFAIGLLLCSLAPCAPFLPLMVPKAHGDMSFAGAVVPLVAVGTVILTPVMAPLLIEEVALDAWVLAKMLFLSILLPLAVGAALREYAVTVASKILPAVNVIAKLSALGCVVYGLVLYWREMLDTAGSFGLLSMTIFMVVMGLITYLFNFGLKQNQRSVMSLAMLSRNGAVVLPAALTIPDVDPSVVTYVIMFIIWMIVVGFIAARIFARIAETSVGANST